QNGFALQYATWSFEDWDFFYRQNVAEAAVKQNGFVLELARKWIRGEKDVVQAFTRNALKHVVKFEDVIAPFFEYGLEAFFDDDFNLGRDFNYKIRNASLYLWNLVDERIIETAIKQNGLALKYVKYASNCTKKLALTAVTQNGLALQYANNSNTLCFPYNFCKDKDVVRAAIKQNRAALQYVDESLKNEIQIEVDAYDRDIAVVVQFLLGFKDQYSSIQSLPQNVIKSILCSCWLDLNTIKKVLT
ncbi:MAG: DUF4116 domain-containing protein, partial [Parachlamydiaceae bacterium]|nr:DUF4116 domain-containing protein [Parachlamydiaceae bacterium]